MPRELHVIHRLIPIATSVIPIKPCHDCLMTKQASLHYMLSPLLVTIFRHDTVLYKIRFSLPIWYLPTFLTFIICFLLT